jgi:uncharacterized protein YjbI with pentapeptide repeats
MTAIKFDVRNRFTGAVQFTATIECADDAPTSIKLGLAVRWAFKAGANLADANLARAYLAGANLADANLAGAYLADADLARAYLAGADLAGADLARANLAGAYLAGANLADANLAGADLARANLAGAYLAGAYLAGANLADANLAGADLARADLARAYLAGQPIIDGGLRSDGFRFFLTAFKTEGLRIKAGCRNFASFDEARSHWRRTRGGTALGDETFAILDHLERMAYGRRILPIVAEDIAA